MPVTPVVPCTLTLAEALGAVPSLGPTDSGLYTPTALGLERLFPRVAAEEVGLRTVSEKLASIRLTDVRISIDVEVEGQPAAESEVPLVPAPRRPPAGFELGSYVNGNDSDSDGDDMAEYAGYADGVEILIPRDVVRVKRRLSKPDVARPRRVAKAPFAFSQGSYEGNCFAPSASRS
eukprot:IDg17728t1